MDLARGLGRLLSVATVFASAMLVPGPAAADRLVPGAADCASIPLDKAVASADLAFVGLVTATANEGRSATVTVTEVWRGDVPSPVTVDGGQDPTNPAEDDRTFEVGVTYLFVPVGLDGLRNGRLVDSLCSATTPWSDELAALRPPELGTALSGSAGSAGVPGILEALALPALMAGLIGGGAFVVALVVARRRDA